MEDCVEEVSQLHCVVLYVTHEVRGFRKGFELRLACICDQIGLLGADWRGSPR